MKISLKKTPKLPQNPIFKGMPEELKNPDRYKEVEQALRLVMFSDHSHKTMKQFMGCKRCQVKTQKKRELIKEYGFVTFEQYLEWRKVMDIIVNQKPIQL
jgi:hypothetical protein